jgi:fatty-acyl-CoA synthase
MLSTMQNGQFSLADLLQYTRRVHADVQVTTWTEGEPRRTTYREVGRDAARLAHALRGLGVTGDQRVATFMWNNAEHLTAFFAVPARGAVLHTLNVRLFPGQLIYTVNHAEDHVVLVDGSLVPHLAELLPRMTTVRHVVVVNGDPSTLQAPATVEVHGYDDLLAGQPDDFPWPDIDERQAAAMCYTSGTTGDPKGVVYSHRSIWLHSLQDCMTNSTCLYQGDRSLVLVPMFHVLAWGLPHSSAVIGGSLILPDRFLQSADIARMLASERPTLACGVPTIWQAVLRYLESAPQDISHLREIVVGGSACPPALFKAYEERHGIPLLHSWGMTETSPLGTVARPPAGADPEQAWAYRLSQGRFPAPVRARLLDDAGRELPWDDESVGEVELRGPWVAGGYYGGVDPDQFHDGWLRTGDVGRISPDGYLTLTDRTKDVIKSGGEWISSIDLENQVMAHPAVAEAASIGVPDERWGERPLVAVVLHAGHHATPAELRAFLSERVPRGQWPERWTFVVALPKTSVGKADKKRLRELYANDALDLHHLDPPSK